MTPENVARAVELLCEAQDWDMSSRARGHLSKAIALLQLVPVSREERIALEYDKLAYYFGGVAGDVMRTIAAILREKEPS